MSDKNVNLNTPENPKDKATKKHAEYKAIPSLTDEQFYPQKKHDYLVSIHFMAIFCILLVKSGLLRYMP